MPAVSPTGPHARESFLVSPRRQSRCRGRRCAATVRTFLDALRASSSVRPAPGPQQDRVQPLRLRLPAGRTIAPSRSAGRVSRPGWCSVSAFLEVASNSNSLAGRRGHERGMSPSQRL